MMPSVLSINALCASGVTSGEEIGPFCWRTERSRKVKTLLEINLLIAWLWVLLGFVGGAVMGMNFHKEDWLGGYGSWKRRLYRLSHISFFGLALINFMFYVTGKLVLLAEPVMGLASCAFVLGAVTMPLCCVLAAHFPKLRSLFAVPVTSLLAGVTITISKLIQL